MTRANWLGAVGLLVLAGCDGLECGPGTYETDGLCLPDAGSETDVTDTEDTHSGTAPIADAGEDQQTAEPGTEIVLDGSGSSDPQGDTLTYAWSILSMPEGSKSALTASDTVSTSFTPDALGTYTVELVVSDGAESDADTVDVVIGESSNRPPSADAGEDQTVNVGDTVQLDATGSSDPDGDELTYGWIFNPPKDSSAELSDETSPTPTFVADVAGPYACNLNVSDGELQMGTVVIVVAEDGSGPTDTETDTDNGVNDPPVADAGSDQTVSLGDDITLDGTGSSDPDGDSLTYKWKVTSVPSGSSLGSGSIGDRSAVTTTFTPDTDGEFEFQLKVSDAEFDDTDTVTFTVE